MQPLDGRLFIAPEVSEMLDLGRLIVNQCEWCICPTPREHGLMIYSQMLACISPRARCVDIDCPATAAAHKDASSTLHHSLARMAQHCCGFSHASCCHVPKMSSFLALQTSMGEDLP